MKTRITSSIFQRAAMMLLTMMLTTLSAWAGNTDPYVQIVSAPTYTSSGTSVTLRIWFWNYDGDNARFTGNTYLTIDGTNTVNLANMWSTFITSNEDAVKDKSGTGQYGSTGTITLSSTNVGTATLKNLKKQQSAASGQSYGDGANSKFNTIDLELSFNSSFSYYGHTLGIIGTWQDKCDNSSKANASKHITIDIPGYPRCTSVTPSHSESAPLAVSLSWATERYNSSANTSGNWIVYRGTTQVASVAYGTTSYTDNIDAYTGSQTITYTVTFCPTDWSVSTTSPTGLYSSNDISLTAITYTVHFDANGGTGTAPDDMTFTYGMAQNLTANAFTRTGYTFAGWNTVAAPTNENPGTSYSDQQSVQNLTTTHNDVITLYAQWTPINYTITYNLGGGTNAEGNPATYTIESDDITLSAPTRTGYTFGGWTGTGLDAATTTVTIAQGSTGNREYTALWTAHTYTVVFNANGGSGEMSSQQFTYDVAQNLPTNTFTKGYFTFLGWNTQTDGSGTSYTDGQSVQNLTAENNGTVTLYAQWPTLTSTWTTGDCTANLYSDGTMIVSGTGAMENYDNENLRPWHSCCSSITAVVINEGVTSIGTNAFLYCTKPASITIPASVTSINPYAFNRCTSLASVTFADNSQLTSIEQSAFYNCTKLASITIPSSVTSIGRNVFDSCTSLATITIPSSVTNIGAVAFYRTPWWNTYSADAKNQYGNIVYINQVAYLAVSTDITECSFKDGTVSIGVDAFKDCTSLAAINIPSSVTSIGDYAFKDCTSLASVTFADNSQLTSIEESAFCNCTSLSSVTIPSSVTSIGWCAFFECSNLNYIEMMSTNIGSYHLEWVSGVASTGVFVKNTAMTSLSSGTDGIPTGWSVVNADPSKTQRYGAVNVYDDGAGTPTKTAVIDGSSAKEVSITSDIAVGQVLMTRQFTNGVASTVMLPFSYTCNGNEGGTFYTFGGVSFNETSQKWVATMNAVSGTLTANTPYLVMPSANGMMSFTGGATLNTTGGGEKQTADVTNWQFNGSYAKKTWTELGHDYGFAATSVVDTENSANSVEAGQFVRIDAGAWMRPMRCYLSYVGGGASQRRAGEQLPGSITVRLVGANGEVTKIENGKWEMENSSTAQWYTLDGRKLAGKPTRKGLYIYNGKIYVIK